MALWNLDIYFISCDHVWSFFAYSWHFYHSEATSEQLGLQRRWPDTEQLSDLQGALLWLTKLFCCSWTHRWIQEGSVMFQPFQVRDIFHDFWSFSRCSSVKGSAPNILTYSWYYSSAVSSERLDTYSNLHTRGTLPASTHLDKVSESVIILGNWC